MTRVNGSRGQVELKVAVLLGPAFGRARLSVQVLALLLHALALHADGPGQSAGRDLHARQPLDDLLGLGRRHLADGQRGDFLHAGGSRALAGQAQEGVGRETPFFAAPAVAAVPFDADVAPAGLHSGAVALRQATELVLTVRTQGRGGGGFLLGRPLEHLAEQFVPAAQEFLFQMAEILIGGASRDLESSG